MKKSTMAIAAVGVVGLLLMGTALATTASNGNGTDDGGHFKWAKQMLGKFMHRHHERVQNAMKNMTEVGGTLTYENGTYYVGGQAVSFGPEWFLENVTARSDYDMDGSYETMKKELEGLEGAEVTTMGIMKNDTVNAFYINGIWYRNPVRMPQEISEITGTLEFANNSYTVNGQEIFFGNMGMLFNRVARSDYDRDGQIESMYYELQGLLDKEVTLDGFYRGDIFVPAHIDGIWYRGTPAGL
ncbi:MAG: hypothetical protein J7L93_00300 [Thermoplasmata archaeon]|nr:hypothetical protein [Thermoplasmata archaeon]